MVNWSGTSNLSGYNSIDQTTVLDAFVFGSPGTFDLNGKTRLGYYLAPKQFAPIDHLIATIRLNFTSGDVAALTDSQSLGALMYIADADQWPAGYVPTPKEIIDKHLVRRWPAGFVRVSGPKTFTIEDAPPTPTTKYALNNKLWVCVVPALRDARGFTGPTFRPLPLTTSGINTLGRAVSVWTNQTPQAPQITSPLSGQSFSPGDSVQFRYKPNHPDATTPDDSAGFNANLCGVEVQYSAPVTPGSPDPEWHYLDMWLDDDTVAPSWYIKNSIYNPGRDELHKNRNFASLVTNRGGSIFCGLDDPKPGQMFLPGGTWRVRVRTYSFGQPTPLWPPLGDFTSNRLTPEQFEQQCVSPWSEPVTMTVTSQVAVPTLISPRDNIAVSDDRDSVRLQWVHRSSARPAYPQDAREIQMKKVTDTDWVTVAAGVSGNEYFDMPMDLVSPPPVGVHEYLTDLGFEGGTVDGWVGSGNLDETIMPTDGTQTVINVSGGAHSGTKSIAIDYAGDGWATMSKHIDLAPNDTAFRWSGWMKPNDASDFTFALMIWRDADDEIIVVPDGPSAGVGETKSVASWGGWVEFDTGWFDRPCGAVKVELTSYSFIGSSDGHGLDDLSFLGRDDFQTGDFTLEATTQYEWRARTRDTDCSWSGFSPSAKFWLVPAPASGGVKPVPSETIDGATLGCGTHRAFIYRRGGKIRVGELTGIEHLDWERKRDDISTSKIVVKDWSVDCGTLLSLLQCWAYEIVIFRDNGYSVDRVWEGPITLLTYEQDAVTIQAKDVMGYAYRRILKQNMSDAGKGNGRTVVARATSVLQNVFAPDDPNILQYLTPVARGDDAMQYRSTPAYSRTAFEEVDDMAANAGLDYTCVGRSILLWGTKHRIGTLPEFRDEDLGAPPVVSEYGMSMANRYVVSDGNGVWGEATRLDVSGNDETYGLVEMLSSTWASDSADETGTYTPEGLETIKKSFAEFAERSIADRYPPPVIVRVPDNTTLNPGTVLSIQQLVPGVVIPLRSVGTLRSVVASQKLDSVRVIEEKGNETISITLSPFSRDDAGGGEVEEG